MGLLEQIEERVQVRIRKLIRGRLVELEPGVFLTERQVAERFGRYVPPWTNF